MIDGGLIAAFAGGVLLGSIKEAAYQANDQGKPFTIKKAGVAVFREPLAVCGLVGTAYNKVSGKLTEHFVGETTGEGKKCEEDELKIDEIKAIVLRALGKDRGSKTKVTEVPISE